MTQFGSNIEWQLWYRDTFDRETPVSIEKSGTGILDGLYALWWHTLVEGITEAGLVSFSAFWLTWGEGDDFNTVKIDVEASSNKALIKLRHRADIHPSTGFSQDEKNPLVMKAARRHYELLQVNIRSSERRRDSSLEARDVLKIVDSLQDMDKL